MSKKKPTKKKKEEEEEEPEEEEWQSSASECATSDGCCGQEKRAKAKALMKYEREVTNMPGKKKKPEEKREY